MSTQHERVDQLFHEARKLAVGERRAFLDHACGDDSALRAELDSMLQHHDRPARELDSAVMGQVVGQVVEWTESARDELPIPERIGPFEIQSRIASGGMGTVYRATQENPHRTVALKVMKWGISSTVMRQRFEHEAQLLALLRHPGIAQVYQAGTFGEGADGLPYFAMEYIADSLPITEYARQKQMPMRDRLKLFSLVCDAVDHGHQQGVIHRDLKPTNILVGGDGQPKVIDFGVARMTDSDMTSLRTETGQLIGTLQYMSPEQCAGNPRDLDERSDVYSLGVVLYELLTDTLPYELRQLPIPAAIRVVSEQEPSKLSTLDSRLRGDVETIVGKCLQKDCQDRYRNAGALSEDVKRYLAGDSILGRPPSVGYQLRVLARRNKAAFLATAAVMVALVVTTVVSTTMYVNAVRAQRATEEAKADLAKQHEMTKEKERHASTVAAFISDSLTAIDPATHGAPATVEAMIRLTTEQLETGILEEQPLVEAEVRLRVARACASRALAPNAELHFTKAIEIYRRELGSEVLETLKAEIELGELLFRDGRHGELNEMAPRVYETLKRIQSMEHDATLRSMQLLGMHYCESGSFAEGEQLLRRAVDLRMSANGEEDHETLEAMRELATQLIGVRRNAEAEDLLRQVVAIRRRVFGKDDQHLPAVLNQLSRLFIVQGKSEEAKSTSEEALKLATELWGEQSRETRNTMYWVAKARAGRGDLSGAEEMYRRLLENNSSEGGPRAATTLMEIGYLKRTAKKFEEARALFQEALTLQREIKSNNIQVVYAQLGLGRSLLDLDRHSEAEPHLLAAYEFFHSKYGDTRKEPKVIADYLVRLYWEQGRPEESKRWKKIAKGEE